MKDEETRRFIDAAFRDGALKTTGTDMDMISVTIENNNDINRDADNNDILSIEPVTQEDIQKMSKLCEAAHDQENEKLKAKFSELAASAEKKYELFRYFRHSGHNYSGYDTIDLYMSVKTLLRILKRYKNSLVIRVLLFIEGRVNQPGSIVMERKLLIDMVEHADETVGCEPTQIVKQWHPCKMTHLFNKNGRRYYIDNSKYKTCLANLLLTKRTKKY